MLCADNKFWASVKKRKEMNVVCILQYISRCVVKVLFPRENQFKTARKLQFVTYQ